MGYKLAGYTVLGNCEIDPEMMKLYKKNHHPKYPYMMDIREFNRLQVYPEEVRYLDILDGSPPRVLRSRGPGEGMGKGKGILGRTEETASG